MFPAKAVLVARVAAVPICQKTLQDNPPPVNKTDELAAVVSAVPIWKYHASFDDVPASVKVPVRDAAVLKLYVPGGKFMPPRSPVRSVAPLRPARVLYAD